MLMSVLMELTAVIKYVATLLEATLVHVTLAIVWHLMDKYVMVSPIHWSITCVIILYYARLSMIITFRYQ